VAIPNELFYRAEIGHSVGPWVAVDGYLTADEQTPGRHVFGFLKALLVRPQDVDLVKTALTSAEHPSLWSTPRPPEDYYTFAGEIPWSPQFGAGSESDAYRDNVGERGVSGVSVEILSHHYSWESYHSALNKAGGVTVPSRTFSEHFDLRGLPQSFDQVLPAGTVVAKSLAAPSGFGGYLLYLREDLLHRFAAGRRLVWFIWGERSIRPLGHEPPEWLVKILRSGENVWRQVRGAEELSPLFASQPKRRSRRSSRRPSVRRR
jgi:hypothetical protein